MIDRVVGLDDHPGVDLGRRMRPVPSRLRGMAWMPTTRPPPIAAEALQEVAAGGD